MLGVKLLHIHFESGLARGLSRGGVSSACRRRLSGAFAVTQSDSVRWPAAVAQAMSTCMQCDLGSGVQSALQGQDSAPRLKQQPHAISFRLSPAPPPSSLLFAQACCHAWTLFSHKVWLHPR